MIVLGFYCLKLLYFIVRRWLFRGFFLFKMLKDMKKYCSLVFIFYVFIGFIWEVFGDFSFRVFIVEIVFGCNNGRIIIVCIDFCFF